MEANLFRGLYLINLFLLPDKIIFAVEVLVWLSYQSRDVRRLELTSVSVATLEAR